MRAYERIEEDTVEFLLNLRRASAGHLQRLIDDSSNLTHRLKDINTVWQRNPTLFTKCIITKNFLSLLVGLATYDVISDTPEILMVLYKLVLTYCPHDMERLKILEQIGITSALIKVMESEKQNGLITYTHQECDCTITVAHVFSEFLPGLSYSPCHQALNDIGMRILFAGPHRNATNTKNILSTLERIFPQLYDLCKKSQPLLVQQVLLLKTMHWANDLNVLTNFVKIEELLTFVKDLVRSDSKENTIVGLAIMETLIDSHLRAFQNAKLHEVLHNNSNVNSLLKDDTWKWVADMWARSITFWLDTYQEMIPSPEDFQSRVNKLNKITEFLLPGGDDNMDLRSRYELRYNRLTSSMASVLNLPENMPFNEPDVLQSMVEQTKGIERFKDLVTTIVEIVDFILIDQGFLICIADMDDRDGWIWSPKIPKNISLGLCVSASLNRVLCLSNSPDELQNNPLVQALRLLSIYHEVNENWGLIFGLITTEKLIDRSYFVSKNIQAAYLNMVNRTTYQEFGHILRRISELEEHYPFLLSYEMRVNFFSLELDTNLYFQRLNTYELPIDVPRKNLANFVSDNLNLFFTSKGYDWRIQFEGELATGRGPLKEFYTEFSRDCQRHDLEMWMGDPVKSSNGVLYVHSQEGLFPKPFLSIQSERLMEALGIIMAQSFRDGVVLDVSFSKAFYKHMMGTITGVQYLSLGDLKYVIPSTFKFVISLIKTMKEKWNINSNESLTPEERTDAIAKLKCDGCSFEDLCINFTLPGFPSIKMKKGGEDILLSAHNVEEYLQLLIWWLLHKGPEGSFKRLRHGFNSLIPGRFLKRFYYDELDQLFCGVQKEEWTVEYLRGNCDLSDGISEETPVVQYLFEVLSSLSASDQGKFLLFVTSSPRLPCGGLRSLTPTLTIKVRESDGDPDKYLPSSSTCFNVLVINRYSCKETLEERLLFAIREGLSSFGYV